MLLLLDMLCSKYSLNLCTFKKWINSIVLSSSNFLLWLYYLAFIVQQIRTSNIPPKWKQHIILSTCYVYISHVLLIFYVSRIKWTFCLLIRPAPRNYPWYGAKCLEGFILQGNYNDTYLKVDITSLYRHELLK